jgi:rare lipoprotein A
MSLLEGQTMTIAIQALVLLLVLNLMSLNAIAKNGPSGQATVYSDKYQGKKTASGERYNKRSMTAASSTLPLGSKVLVRNRHNGHSLTVLINDRKASGGSKLDLSKAAAHKLGITGTAQVSSRVVKEVRLR